MTVKFDGRADQLYGKLRSLRTMAVADFSHTWKYYVQIINGQEHG